MDPKRGRTRAFARGSRTARLKETERRAAQIEFNFTTPFRSKIGGSTGGTHSHGSAEVRGGTPDSRRV